MAGGYNGLGLVCASAGRQGIQALYNFRRALSADPGLVEAQYNIAMLYERLRPLDARGAYERVVEMQADHPDAYFRLGRILEGEGDLQGGFRAHRKQLEVHPVHGQARYRLGKLLFAHGKRREAAREFGRLIALGAQVEPRACVEMAVLSQVAGEFGESQRLFEAYIDSLPPADQPIFHDISLVATRDELALYEAAADGDKGELIRRFWARQDPTPLTQENERLVEHYRRVAYAREHYGREGAPWDARGEVYVRFGTPDHISRSDDIQAETERWLQDARQEFVNRNHVDLAVRPGYPSFPVRRDARWEYWVYSQLGGGTEFTFVSRYGDRRYVYAPVPDGLPPRATVELAAIHGGTLVEDIAADRPSAYEADFADLPIDFYYYPASFRGSDGRTRLEVYYGLPASEVVRMSLGDKTDLLVLERGVAIHDSLWYEVHRESERIAFQAPTDQQIAEGAFIPGVLPVELSPGTYRMALQVRDVLSGKSQIYRQDVCLDDYGSTHDLQVSDIELAFTIVPGDSVGTFAKSGLKVIPMSSKSYRRDQSAFVYFEIYNLVRDAFGQTHYRVDYTIRSYEKRSVPARVLRGLGRMLRLTERDQEVVISYEHSGSTRDETAYVELDLAETEPGGQLVRARVTDLQSEQSAEKQITFRIVP